jgi:Ca2+-binding EF-hand superfamily protein
MKLQVLIVVYACALPFHVQAEEGNRERFVRPFSEKRGENSENKGERNDKMRPHSEGMGDMFGMLDKDRDGVITQEEFFAGPRMANLPQEQRDKLFSRIDSDGNGSITPEEVRKMRQESQEMHKRQMRELDTDKSGGLSYEEMSNGKFFSQLPEEKRMQIFKRMDTNSDGQITPEDKPKGPRPHPEGRPERRPEGKPEGKPEGRSERKPTSDQAPSAFE